MRNSSEFEIRPKKTSKGVRPVTLNVTAYTICIILFSFKMNEQLCCTGAGILAEQSPNQNSFSFYYS